MKVRLAQINPVIGGFEANYQKISEILLSEKEADLVVFPECAICGYPPQDLLDFPAFVEQAEEYRDKLTRLENAPAFLVGGIERNLQSGKPIFNAAYFIKDQKIQAKYFKRLLPTYDVFDEDRFFQPGKESLFLHHMGKKIHVSLCEDIWGDLAGSDLHRRYNQFPMADAGQADVLINLSASPFEAKKVNEKREMLKTLSKKYAADLLYVNCVGANDSIIFDGRSYWLGADGNIKASAKAFEEQNLLIDLESKGDSNIHIIDSDIENIYDALILGIRDYFKKVGFETAILGLSGGIDSAVVACIAADAIGAENVHCVMMPSQFTSKESNEDAVELAKATQSPLHIYIIEHLVQMALKTLEKNFEGTKPGLAEENLQSRIRGTLLMAMSNKHNHLLLNTGNKSEMAVGYCTLYGDMNGGLAVLSDVYKGQVYQLGKEANRRQHRIPDRMFTKAPSAELRANQKDEDSLPPYERLDAMLEDIIENRCTRKELVAKGFDEAEVREVFKLVSRNEYKRYQMPLGLKVSPKAFGVGRRIPLVHTFF